MHCGNRSGPELRAMIVELLFRYPIRRIRVSYISQGAGAVSQARFLIATFLSFKINCSRADQIAFIVRLLQ